MSTLSAYRPLAIPRWVLVLVIAVIVAVAVTVAVSRLGHGTAQPVTAAPVVEVQQYPPMSGDFGRLPAA